MTIPQKPKPRLFKELYKRDTVYGHKVQRDRKKNLKHHRKEKYNSINSLIED